MFHILTAVSLIIPPIYAVIAEKEAYEAAVSYHLHKVALILANIDASCKMISVDNAAFCP